MTDADYFAWLNNPNALRNVLAEVVANVGGTDQTFYLSVEAYVSGPADTPANWPYRAVLVKEDIETTEQVSLSGDASMTIGDIGVANPDGAFDAWMGYVWTNRSAKLLFGDLTWPRSDYRVIFNGVSADIGNKARDTVNLKLRDSRERLNASVSEHLVGGTTASQGTVVPNGLGEIVNMTPLLIDPTTLQYQVHDGAFNGLIELRDNGIPIANDALGWAAATIDLAHGTFRLTDKPAGTITCSFQGDTGGGSYVSTVADVIQRLVTGYGAAGNRFTLAEIDTANFTAFNSAHPQPIGLPLTSTINGVTAVQKVASSLGAQLVPSREGLLQLIQLDFASLTPTFDIHQQHMELQKCSPGPREPVSGSVLLSYCQNQTPQTNLQQTSLPAEALALLAMPFQTSTAVDGPTKALYKLTSDPTQEDTLLLRRADADAEALRRLNIRKVPRTTYQFVGFAVLFRLRVGQHVNLFYPRWGLNNGAAGIVVSMATKWALGRTTVGVMI